MPSLQSLGRAPAELFSPIEDHASVRVLLLVTDVGNPVSDLFASPVAVAYLGVLTVLFGFLSFLAYSDAQGKRRREEMIVQREQVSSAINVGGCGAGASARGGGAGGLRGSLRHAASRVRIRSSAVGGSGGGSGDRSLKCGGLRRPSWQPRMRAAVHAAGRAC